VPGVTEVLWRAGALNSGATVTASSRITELTLLP
jgi:hypothetical protein